MTADGAKHYFDTARSSRYDHKIRASIPGYEALHAMAHDFLRPALPETARLLVVGAGTGMELLTFGAAHPGWRFCAAGIPAAEVEEDFARTDATVSFIPEQDLTVLLEESGFRDIRRFFQAFLFGGWVARKS